MNWLKSSKTTSQARGKLRRGGGDPLRHLRPEEELRLPQRGDQQGHQRVRLRQHRVVVDGVRPGTVPGCRLDLPAVRRRGQQQRQQVPVQGGPAEAVGPAGHRDPRGALPAVLLEVQPDRAAAVPPRDAGLPGGALRQRGDGEAAVGEDADGHGAGRDRRDPGQGLPDGQEVHRGLQGDHEDPLRRPPPQVELPRRPLHHLNREVIARPVLEADHVLDPSGRAGVGHGAVLPHPECGPRGSGPRGTPPDLAGVAVRRGVRERVVGEACRGGVPGAAGGGGVVEQGALARCGLAVGISGLRHPGLAGLGGGRLVGGREGEGRQGGRRDQGPGACRGAGASAGRGRGRGEVGEGERIPGTAAVRPRQPGEHEDPAHPRHPGHGCGQGADLAGPASGWLRASKWPSRWSSSRSSFPASCWPSRRPPGSISGRACSWRPRAPSPPWTGSTSTRAGTTRSPLTANMCGTTGSTTRRDPSHAVLCIRRRQLPDRPRFRHRPHLPALRGGQESYLKSLCRLPDNELQGDVTRDCPGGTRDRHDCASHFQESDREMLELLLYEFAGASPSRRRDPHGHLLNAGFP